MYCKFCGSRIAPNSDRCASCGANINLHDGGQTFFDDNELDAWQTDSVLENGSNTAMPKTEMTDAMQSDEFGYTQKYKNALGDSRAQSNVDSRTSNSRTYTNRTLFDYLNLSSANRLIIFCIASALAIVLLAVAIIAVLNSGEETSEDETINSGYSDTAETESERQGGDNDQNSENDDEDPDHTWIKIKISVNGEEELSDITACTDKNSLLYVSMDVLLLAMGYKYKGNTDDVIIYEYPESGKKIELKKGTKNIKITENNRDNFYELEADNFNKGNDTYVPIISFLKACGYGGISWDNANNILSFSK